MPKYRRKKKMSSSPPVYEAPSGKGIWEAAIGGTIAGLIVFVLTSLISHEGQTLSQVDASVARDLEMFCPAKD